MRLRPGSARRRAGWAETERPILVKAADMELLLVALRAAYAGMLWPEVLV